MSQAGLIISIKKSDGTTERITLAEFKLRQKKTPAPASSQPDLSPKKETSVLSETKKSNSPKTEIKLVEAAVEPIMIEASPVVPLIAPQISTNKKTEKFEASSLLEEELPELPSDTKTSHDRTEEVQTILKKLSFSVPADYAARLQNIIRLCIKEVRSDVETVTLAQKSFAEGGLELNSRQAAEVVALCLAGKDKKTVPKVLRLPDGPPISRPAAAPSLGLHREITSTPEAPASIKPALERKTLPPLEEKFKLNSSARAKPFAQDIAPPSEQMGPVEEIAALSIIDFRRLSSDPQEAMARLVQKIKNLKDESIILYFRALEAWKKSPLYQAYASALIKSLEENIPLAGVTRDKKGIQLSEINALAEFDKQLH